MTTWIPIKPDLKTGVFMEVQRISDFPGDVAFDSELKLSQSGAVNHMLQLNLRIFLNRFMPPFHMTSFVFPDFDGNLFIVGPWSAGEWARFLTGFEKQCSMWNDKFWLIPPVNFSSLDITIGGKTIRPNIYCHLKVAIMPSVARAHRTIKVVNLDAKSAARGQGIRESDVTRGTFRSDSGHYDTFDAIVSTEPVIDPAGNRKPVRHYTIAHEIGHALGQDHIGVMRHEPLCDMAILLDQSAPRGTAFHAAVPAMFEDGSNSSVCYGNFAAVPVSANVMGGGGRFEQANAQPWIDQLARHTGTAMAWTVSMGHIPPKQLP